MVILELRFSSRSFLASNSRLPGRARTFWYTSRVKVHILRVFVDKEKRFGNPVGIVLDEKREIILADRQAVTTKIGFSESVFINDLGTGNLSIFNPQGEIGFAGHALVGTAFFINKVIGKPIDSLVCQGGKVLTWQKEGLTWIRVGLAGTPPWFHEQLQNALSVESLSIPQANSKKHTMVWAWANREKGIIRARTFAPDWGIQEDEANGSGSMQLAVKLGQKLEIHHGGGSIIYAKPAKTGFADVGGRVKEGATQEVVI